MKISQCFTAGALVLATGLAGAGPVHVAFQDWEMACDNTRACEAVGFAPQDDGVPPVTLWLARAAGAGAAVAAKLTASAADDAPAAGPLTLRVGGLTWGGLPSGAVLSPAQIAGLVPALLDAQEADVTDGKNTWRLSLAGIKAALLKIDDVQGRVGGVTALVKPGAKPAGAALPPLPAPVLRRLVPPPTRAQDVALLPRIVKKLPKGGCGYAPDLDGQADDRLYRLSSTRLLVLVECGRGAYQSEFAAWVVDDKPPHAARPAGLGDKMVDGQAHGGAVTAILNPDYDGGRLSSYAKGRGINDCGYQQQWVWTANGFQMSAAASSLLCRGVPGGYSLTDWRAQAD
nr:DUF1176 domain-containing protein [uncultured Duganella sp.]